jgi:hypothetical protein
MTVHPAQHRSDIGARLLGFLGLLLLGLSAILIDVSRGLFVAEDFADRAAASLGDERVSGFVANRLTDAIVAQRPDLTAVRPLLVGTMDGLVGSAPFRAVARTGLRTAHQAFFSKGSQEFLLSVPDVGILVQSALAQANPELARKIPTQVQAVLAGLPKSRVGATLAAARQLWTRVAWLQRTLFLLGPILLIAGILLHPDRRHALMRAGIGLVTVALLLVLLVPAGRLVALLVTDDPAARAALFGLWRAYFLPLLPFIYSMAGSGVIMAAASNSLLEKADPFDAIRDLGRLAMTPPRGRGRRALWTAAVAAAGVVLLVWPSSVVAVLAVIGGLLLVFAAVREVFRLALENVPERSKAVLPGGRSLPLRAVLGVGLAALLVVLLVLWRRPMAEPPVPTDVVACNGAPELCTRRIDQVSFAATHNSMSNAQIPGWMFPNQGLAFVPQLQMGIRALLIDVHYGFPGGERIKTDLEGEGATREKLVGAVGEQGFEAAQRIRNRLVGVDEGKRGLYFCHGFCELGAYPVVPALSEIKDWLVMNPGEVVLFVIEDYVTPEEIAQAFKESGLLDVVYTGPITPFPTLGSMIVANARVLVFIESGKPGVDWLHPAFESFQETPYTFHAPADFSCKPNRGGTSAPLFQVNHWIETTPAPKPSNAAIVNTYAELMKRARTCQRERHLRPTYIAVDFGEIGDIVQVTRKLNGLDTLEAVQKPKD